MRIAGGDAAVLVDDAPFRAREGMGGSDDSHALVGEFPAFFGGHFTLTGAQVAIAVGDIHKVDIHTCLGKGVP